MFENPQFLKKKYDLHNSPEVESAARRTEVRTGEEVSSDPSVLIQNYLDRFKEITDREDPEKRERGLDAIKHVLHDKFVIQLEEVPESYFANQQRLAREQGHGDIEITNEMKEQLTEVIITDQESSLDKWIDYLSSPDATYPDWLKYYSIRSILNLGEYDKEKKQFTKRSNTTTKPFPDLNREALAYVLDAINQKYAGQEINLSTLEEQDKEQFAKLLSGENFAKLYAWAIEKVTPESQDLLVNTQGQWLKYHQGSDHMPLVESLQGHGTGWCTAGESTAQTQLQGGDFYVYYSLDKEGQPTIPRVAIRMQENSIAEVRGVAPEQNLDPYINDIVKVKLAEFPDGPAYEQKSSDMKLLTTIEKKTKQNQALTKAELIFLYEIDRPIEGFGYQKDPRIQELISQRNPQEDAPIVLSCSPEQIAWHQDEITENTKAYIGPLFPGIFQTNLEHIYTSFPEGEIANFNATIGGQNKEELQKELAQGKFEVSSSAKALMNNPEFSTAEKQENMELVFLTVKDLGFPQGTKTADIYQKAKDLGLELCPAELGPQLRLQYMNQPMNEWLYVGMKQMSDSDGRPFVFQLARYDDGERWLDDYWAKPDRKWHPRSRFVFRLRKSES